MKIQSLTISDFRWFGGDYKLDLTGSDGRPSDIVLIYAPNGSGKTSLTEAIEWAFTGKVERIELLLNEYNRKPREGYILRNRDSITADYGSVSISLVDEETNYIIRRSTSPLKNGRKNDYAEGTSDPLHSNPIELNGPRICDYILSQSKINEFLISASSGSLFKTYMSLSGRKRDLEFYYKLRDARPELATRITDAKRRSGTAEHELGRAKKRRQTLLKDLQTKVDVTYDNFAAMFQRVVIPEFAQLEGERFLEILDNANVVIEFLRADIANFGTMVDELKSSSRERRLLVRRDRFSRKKETVRRISDQAKNELHQLQSMSKAIDEFVACASEPEVSQKLLKESALLSMSEANVKRSTRIVGIIEAKEALHLHSLDQMSEVKREIAMLTSWRSEIKSFCDNENTSITAISDLKRKLTEDEQAVERQALLLREIDKRDLNNIGEEARRSYGLESQFARRTMLLNGLDAVDMAIGKIDADILSNASLSTRVSELKSEAIILAREHDTATCPACNHEFGSSSVLIESILQLSNVSDAALKERRVAVELQRVGLASQLRTNEEELYSSLGKVSEQLTNTIGSAQQRLRALRTGLQRIQQISSDFFAHYSTRFPEEELVTHIDSALHSNLEHLSKLQRRDAVQSHQLRRLRALATRATEEAIQLSVDQGLIQNSLVRLGYVQLKKKLEAEWDTDVKAVSTVRGECTRRLSEAAEKVREADLMTAAVDVEFDDLIQINDKFSSKDRERLIEMDVKRAAFRSALVSLKKKICDVNVFSIQRVGLRLDQVFLTAKNFEKSLLASEELLELADQVLVTESQLAEARQERADLTRQLEQLDEALFKCGEYFQEIVRKTTSSDLLNDIYRLIDPHLSYHRIGFDLDMTRGQEGLFIKSGRTQDYAIPESKLNNPELISPSLFFSEAQSNVLSISLFLTKIASARERCFNFMIMDDPVQSMDDINAYAFIDMCRIYAERFQKQLIITTHDLGFYKLFQRRFPGNLFNFKYFDLDSKIRSYK